MTKEKNVFLDLFSGIGGFALAAYWADLRFDAHYFSEIDPYCIELYQKRFPNAIPLGDITKINYSELIRGGGDWLVTGGFPCQPHSYFGVRNAENDKRDLWFECNRVLREIRPSIALFENVPGLLSSSGGRFFNRVLSDISKSGYDAEWQIISAEEIGAPHKRERIWIVAYPRSFINRYENNRKQKHRTRTKNNTKEDRQKPSEWKHLQSINCGNYFMENWEAHEHIITGTYDGIPEELDAIKGAGNAIVPQCAALIFNLPCFDRWRIKGN